jgi:hypothetical protein
VIMLGRDATRYLARHFGLFFALASRGAHILS